jgi:hypothetical protein
VIEIEVQNETHQTQERLKFVAVPRIGEGIRLREPDGFWTSYDVVDLWYQKAEFGDIWVPYLHVRITAPVQEDAPPPMPSPLYGEPEVSPLLSPHYGQPEAAPAGNARYAGPDPAPRQGPQYGQPDAPPRGNPQYGQLDAPPRANAQYGQRETAPRSPLYGNQEPYPFTA